MYKKNRRDANEKLLVDWLKAHGCTVLRLNSDGQPGCPDLLVGKFGTNFLLEIKTTKGKLSEAQTAFADNWKGAKPLVVRNVSDLEDLGFGGI